MIDAMDRALAAGRDTLRGLYGDRGLALDLDQVANEAASTAMRVLYDAGCLVEPSVAAPEMTVEDAAQLLCQLSGLRRLDEPEKDYVQLIDRVEMVDYAWDGVKAAGLDPVDLTRANAARRLLLTRHGRR